MKSLNKIYDSWVYDHTLLELEDLYRSDLQVNRHRLEVASQEQSTKFEKWYAAMEDVEGDLRDATTSLGRKRTKVGLRIRKIFPDDKEGSITAKIESNKEVKILNKRINQIRRYHGKLKGAVESARQRKSMISVLKDLYVSNYWDKSTKHGTPTHGRRQKKEKRKK